MGPICSSETSATFSVKDRVTVPIGLRKVGKNVHYRMELGARGKEDCMLSILKT
jgi:hypothetical protein